MVVSQHSQDTFYQDQEVMADFLDYITFLLNYVNPYTGLGEITDKRVHIEIISFPFVSLQGWPDCAGLGDW